MEGAENLRKVATDKKSVSNVNIIVKKSNSKLTELQQELQELESHILVSQGQSLNSSTGKGHLIAKCKVAKWVRGHPQRVSTIFKGEGMFSQKHIGHRATSMASIYHTNLRTNS